jgi:hypothetical protein
MGDVDSRKAVRLGRNHHVAKGRVGEMGVVEVDQGVGAAHAEPLGLPLVHSGGARGCDAAADEPDEHATSVDRGCPMARANLLDDSLSSARHASQSSPAIAPLLLSLFRLTRY